MILVRIVKMFPKVLYVGQVVVVLSLFSRETIVVVIYP